ncbi:MAG: VOC family protein [Anaerolineae bacterium]
MNPFGHVDLRVSDMERALAFYGKLLPALGFSRTFHSEQWKVFATEGELPGAAYFALTTESEHHPNANSIGFWAASPEEVDRIAAIVRDGGGTVTAGPGRFPISPSYYAVFFEDPFGNRFEITYRVN